MYKSPFLNAIADYMLVRRYSRRTIKSYIYWIKSFINFNQKKHPNDLSIHDFERFLTYLAVDRHVSSSTQSIALNAITFLYNKYLEKDLGDFSQFKRSKRVAKIPTVLTTDEIKLLLNHIPPKYKLIAGLLYGSGLRRMEVVRLRVNDIDSTMMQVRVWNGKGFKHRLLRGSLDN